MSIEGEVRKRNINILNYLKKTIPNCKFNIEVFKNEKIFIDTIDYAIAILELTNKDKEEIDRLRVQLAGCGVAALGYATGKNEIEKDSYGWSASFQDVKDLWDKYIKLTNLKPLSEKEVEKFLDKEFEKIWITAIDEKTTEFNDKRFKKVFARFICSHFSKQIKYPEKKERAPDTEHYDSYVKGWNDYHDKVRKLNGEGGV